MDKRYRELSRAIKPYGYCLIMSNGHLKVTNGEHTFSCSRSPSNVGHWIKNVIRDIERYGS